MYVAITVGAIIFAAGISIWAIWYVNQDKSTWSDQ